MLKIHETIGPSGEAVSTYLGIANGVLALVREGGSFALPRGAVEAVMTRFGAPLEASERLAPVASLELGGGGLLRHVRHLARFDVIARDYLVYESPGSEPLCALATTVAGALEHLARAAQSR